MVRPARRTHKFVVFTTKPICLFKVAGPRTLNFDYRAARGPVLGQVGRTSGCQARLVLWLEYRLPVWLTQYIAANQTYLFPSKLLHNLGLDLRMAGMAVILRVFSKTIQTLP